MKKILLGIMALVAGVMMSACSNDDGGNGGGGSLTDNEFKYGEEALSAVEASQEWYGDAYETGKENLTLFIWLENDNGDIRMAQIDMSLPAGVTELRAGTYTYSEDPSKSNVFGLEYSSYFEFTSYPDEYDAISIESGTLKVSKSGDTYKVSVDCKADGVSLKGKFVGEMPWSDESGSEAAGEGTFTYNGNTLNAVAGFQDWYGNYYDPNLENLSVYIVFEDESQLALDMNLPSGVTHLAAGTYNYSVSESTANVFGLEYSNYYINENNASPVTAGTVTVALNDGVYTITVNCTVGGKTFSGTYTGGLLWAEGE